ncbi:hypothetical protein PIB30_020010 [Stylosanthes scabra]|uniref:Uncharacterized protein n=1 Tax=Stylosanthes scabra TaxID=79078 RepID=A0ABU6Q8C5_9FABA|nr:hypothetical protein [Stylosanthes scabra]
MRCQESISVVLVPERTKILAHFSLPSSRYRAATALPSTLIEPLFAGTLLHCAVADTHSTAFEISFLSLFLSPSTVGALFHRAVAATHCTTFAISHFSSFLAPPHCVAGASFASTSDSDKALIAATRQNTTSFCALESFTRVAYSSSSRDPGRCRQRFFRVSLSSNSALPSSTSSPVHVLIAFLFGGNGGGGGEMG